MSRIIAVLLLVLLAGCARGPDEDALAGDVQARLDEFARERGYADIVSACSYATSTVDKYKTEAKRCVKKRDEAWSTLYALIETVDTGARPELSIDDLAQEFLDLKW
jgi:hypothetical protein